MVILDNEHYLYRMELQMTKGIVGWANSSVPIKSSERRGFVIGVYKQLC